MKILFFDIETRPIVAYTWGKYLDGSVVGIKEEWQLLSVSWKWLGERQVYFQRAENNSDLNLCKIIQTLFTDADVVVAHNGDEFDVKKCRARFVFHKLPPTKHIATVDTRKVARRHFAFTSNSLNDLGVFLGIGKKAKHAGFDTWIGCMSGDKKSWKIMERYNKQDVRLLEKVYKRLRPYMERHPNIAAISGKGECPKCGSSNVAKRGVRGNATGLQQQMHCVSCKGWYLTRFKKEKA